jgi:FdhD protein
MRHPPQSAKPTHVLEWDGGRKRRLLDEVAAEEPLEIRIGGESLSVTMRTPGDDFELAAGFLLTEGLVTRRDEIARIAYDRGPDDQPSGNLVAVTLAAGKAIDTRRVERRFLTTSSCGVCGKASIDALRVRQGEAPDHSLSIDPRLLTRLPGALRSAQRVFGRTGGLHAAALFDSRGTLMTIREDIGRHNAVDKVIGHELLNGRLPLSDRILMVSGRGGFEIVQKALVAGLPIVASVSAPSTLAVQLSREYGLTLIGFLRGSRFIVYSGERRLRMDAAAPAAVRGAIGREAKSRRGKAASPSSDAR